MTLTDPYPESLVDDIEPAPLAPADPLVRAVNRLAQAVEQNTLAILDRTPHATQNVPPAPVPQRQALAPLPAVQVVPQKPPCPYHGLDKVLISTNGKGGFFCAAKAGPGQPSNAKGYCTWHS